MSVAALPRIDGPIVRPHRPRIGLSRSSALLVNRLSSPRQPLATKVEGLSLRIAAARVALDGPPEIADGVEVSLVFEEGGCLGLRLPAAILDRLARAVQPDLGTLPPGPAGPLILELALAPLFASAERITGRTIQLEAIGPIVPQAGAITLILDAAIEGEGFPAQVDLGTLPALSVLPARIEALARLVEAAPPRPASVTGLPVPLAFVAGRTRLTIGQLNSLQVGDAVLPDIWHPARGETLVVLGTALAAPAMSDRHTTRLQALFRPVAEEPAAASGTTAGMAQDRTSGQTNAGSTDEASLDAVGVTLTFEFGRRNVAIGDLKTMGAGHVFDLGLDPAEPVEIFANGAQIGRGEIVEIGERLGIRMVRLFGRE